MITHDIKSARYVALDDLVHVNIIRDNGQEASTSIYSDVQGGMIAFLADGGVIDPYVAPAVTSSDVNAERDRRINAGFVYAAAEYQTDVGSRENIAGAQGLSLGAMIADPQGTQGLRWDNPDVDFAWTDATNNEIPMTAAQCQAFCQAAMQYKSALIKAARVIKDLNPIPGDYADDSHWPSRALD